MGKVLGFVRREPVLTAASVAAAASCFFVPPDAEYAGYLDFRTLALLYSLMVVVAGLRKAGVFSVLADTLCSHAGSTRTIGFILVALCFFGSMLITNDVALLTFVPFSVVVLGMAGRPQDLVRVVVLQTVAANLGSMLTPVGNPQNLYLYSHYNIPMGGFFAATLPVWLVSLALIAAACFLIPRAGISVKPEGKPEVDRKALALGLTLFCVCLLTVVRVLDWRIMLAVVVLTLVIFDRKALLGADFMLLLTFVAFFVFAGNLARLDAVDALLRKLLDGREYLTSLAASQVISNVPAALLLSGFTDNARALLLGTNVGGLGTPIASLASLISLKLYFRSEGARPGRFMAEFTAANVVLLVLLSAFCLLVM